MNITQEDNPDSIAFLISDATINRNAIEVGVSHLEKMSDIFATSDVVLAFVPITDSEDEYTIAPLKGWNLFHRFGNWPLPEDTILTPVLVRTHLEAEALCMMFGDDRDLNPANQT